MQYLLTLYADESGWAKMTPEQQQQGVAAYGAYTQALSAAGILKSSNRLRPSSTATTLRTTNGKTQVLDGPFIDSKEQLGGYYLIDVPDLDAALSWAGQMPRRRPWRCRSARHLVDGSRMRRNTPAQNRVAAAR